MTLGVSNARGLLLALLGAGALSLATATTVQATDTSAASPLSTSPTAVAAGPTGPVHYHLDSKRSTVVIRTFKVGVAAAFAHDHAIVSHDVTGEIVADVADPTTATVHVSVPTASLVVDDARIRQQFKLDAGPSDADKKEVDAHMKDGGQLDVAHFPVVTFSSTRVSKDAAGKLMLTGDLNLHGVTRSVQMPIVVDVTSGTLVGDAQVGLKTSDFGIRPYSALFGAVGNKDEIVLHLHLVATAP